MRPDTEGCYLVQRNRARRGLTRPVSLGDPSCLLNLLTPEPATP